MKESEDNFTDYIPAHRKELYYKIINDYHDLHTITLRLHFLEEHFPPNRLNEALGWLVRHRYTGKNFIQWFLFACKNSDLEMHRYLLAEIDRADPTHIIAGKNFKV